MSLRDHALEELKKAGYYDKDCFYGSGVLAKAVLDLIETFSKAKHSGISAIICLELFNKLARFDVLTPLTGEDDEWIDVSDMFFSAKILYKGEDSNNEADKLVDKINRYSGPEKKIYQNRRCSHVFKEEDGKAYDSRAIIFRDKDGATYQNSESRKYVTFPYMPKTEIIDKI